MAFQHKPNSGAVFENRYKKSDKHPAYKGDAMIDGKLYEVAVWERTTRAGKAMLSFKFEEPRDRQQQSPSFDERPKGKSKPQGASFSPDARSEDSLPSFEAESAGEDIDEQIPF